MDYVCGSCGHQKTVGKGAETSASCSCGANAWRRVEALVGATYGSDDGTGVRPAPELSISTQEPNTDS